MTKQKPPYNSVGGTCFGVGMTIVFCINDVNGGNKYTWLKQLDCNSRQRAVVHAFCAFSTRIPIDVAHSFFHQQMLLGVFFSYDIYKSILFFLKGMFFRINFTLLHRVLDFKATTKYTSMWINAKKNKNTKNYANYFR